MLRRFVSMFCCAALLAAVPALADQWDKKTTVTFSHPIELPGVVLPAGTYVFKLLDSPSDRHIVQVFNTRQDHLYATILAIPNYRLTPADKTVLTFDEGKKGTPDAVRAWFYPADNFGQEFVYPKKRAHEIAQAVHAPVLTAEVTPTEKPEELVKEPVVAATPENKEVELAQVVPPAAVEPAPVQPEVARAEPLPAVNPQELGRELPKTDSALPLLLLLGVLAIGVGVALRITSRRVS